MNVEDDEIQKLKNKINKLNNQIDLVTEKKNNAELAVRKLVHELNELNTVRLETSHELHKLESKNCDMWENIGDGG